MNYMSALVLPLQGFFNCVIYCFFSRKNLYKEFCRLMTRYRSTSSAPANHSADGSSADKKRTRSHEAISRQTDRDLNPAYDDEDEITVADNEMEFMAVLERSSRMEYLNQSATRMNSPA
jgi:hypothetical protein